MKKFRTLRQKIKNPVAMLKAGKFANAIGNARAAAARVKDLKDLPADQLIYHWSNQVKLRQIEWTEKGSPITEEDLQAGLDEEWNGAGWVYAGAGVTKEQLWEAGLEAIADTSGAEPLPKPIQWLVNKTGRNAKCPCGSGKKYKKCCGK